MAEGRKVNPIKILLCAQHVLPVSTFSLYPVLYAGACWWSTPWLIPQRTQCRWPPEGVLHTGWV